MDWCCLVSTILYLEFGINRNKLENPMALVERKAGQPCKICLLCQVNMQNQEVVYCKIKSTKSA
jgi:hypothetical protein